MSSVEEIREKFWEELEELIAATPQSTDLIIMGDLNAEPCWEKEDEGSIAFLQLVSGVIFPRHFHVAVHTGLHEFVHACIVKQTGLFLPSEVSRW